LFPSVPDLCNDGTKQTFKPRGAVGDWCVRDVTAGAGFTTRVFATPIQASAQFFYPWALDSYSSCCDVEAMSLGFMSVGQAAIVSQMADCAPVNYVNHNN
jgi:hypothetical protein